MTKLIRRNISVTNKRVNDAFEKVGKGKVSRFVEECILYYLDNIDSGYVTADQVKSIMLDYLKDVPTMNGPISNPNYVNEVEQVADDLEDAVLDMLNL